LPCRAVSLELRRLRGMLPESGGPARCRRRAGPATQQRPTCRDGDVGIKVGPGDAAAGLRVESPETSRTDWCTSWRQGTNVRMTSPIEDLVSDEKSDPQWTLRGRDTGCRRRSRAGAFARP
jgi:hypothetical protein